MQDAVQTKVQVGLIKLEKFAQQGFQTVVGSGHAHLRHQFPSEGV